MYGFRKLHQDPLNGEFVHPNFKRGEKELLSKIERRGKKRKADVTDVRSAHQASSSTTCSSTGEQNLLNRSTNTSNGMQGASLAAPPPSTYSDEQRRQALELGVMPNHSNSSIMGRLNELQAAQLSLQSRVESLEQANRILLSNNGHLYNCTIHTTEQLRDLRGKVTNFLTRVCAASKNSSTKRNGNAGTGSQGEKDEGGDISVSNEAEKIGELHWYCIPKI